MGLGFNQYGLFDIVVSTNRISTLGGGSKLEGGGGSVYTEGVDLSEGEGGSVYTESICLKLLNSLIVG